MPSNHNDRAVNPGQAIGPLAVAEKQLVLQQQQSNIRSRKRDLTVCGVVIVLAAIALIVGALYQLTHNHHLSNPLVTPTSGWQLYQITSLIVLLLSLLTAGIFYRQMRNARYQLQRLHGSAMEVFRVSGKLQQLVVLDKRSGDFAIRVDDFTLPGVHHSGMLHSQQDTPRELRKLRGQTITADYIPDIAQNRCYYDAQGKGFNFITHSLIE